MKHLLASFSLVCMALPIQAQAQFIETACPLLWNGNPEAKLISAEVLQDGENRYLLPNLVYMEKGRIKIDIVDYRYNGDLIYRHAKLSCSYAGPDDLEVFIDVPGLLTRWETQIKLPHPKNGKISFVRAFATSDISPQPEAGKQ